MRIDCCVRTFALLSSTLESQISASAFRKLPAAAALSCRVACSCSSKWRGAKSVYLRWSKFLPFNQQPSTVTMSTKRKVEEKETEAVKKAKPTEDEEEEEHEVEGEEEEGEEEEEAGGEEGEGN